MSYNGRHQQYDNLQNSLIYLKVKFQYLKKLIYTTEIACIFPISEVTYSSLRNSDFFTTLHLETKCPRPRLPPAIQIREFSNHRLALHRTSTQLSYLFVDLERPPASSDNDFYKCLVRDVRLRNSVMCADLAFTGYLG